MLRSRAVFFLISSLFTTCVFAQHNAATRPPRTYDLKNVEWHLSFDETLGTIDGDVTNTVVPLKANTKEVWFDSVKLKINKVMVNGQTANVTQKGEQIFVSLPKTSGPKDTLAVRIQYTGRPEAGIYFIPAQRAYPAHTSVVYTQGEMIDTRYWLPTYDNPDDKTTWDSYLTVPSNYTVILNGRFVDTKTHGATKTVHYRMDVPMSTYLISLITGQYETGDDGHFGSAPVRWNVPVGLSAMGKAAFGGTDKMIAFYSKQTGFPYPYAKFEQSAVPDYMFGGMENITAVTQTINAIFPPDAAPVASAEGLDLHELAHQWFGDTVTCEQWQHAWLNEGWATFLPNFYLREAHGQEAYDLGRYGTLQGGIFGNNETPIVWTGYQEPIDEFFFDNIYSGGASRMFWLMHTVGEDKFWNGIKDYLNTYKYQPVTTEKFFDSMSKSTGVDLHQFMKEWFYTPGVPDLTVKRDGNDLLIDQKAPIYTLPLDVWVLSNDQWVKKQVLSNSAETRLPLGDLAGKPALVDPEVFLPARISYDWKPTAEEVMDVYRHAPNAAAKARLQDMIASNNPLSSDQTKTLCDEEKNDDLWQRMVGGVKDMPYVVKLLDDPDPKRVAAIAGNEGKWPVEGDYEKKLRDVAFSHPNILVRQAAVSTLLGALTDDDLAARAWAMPSYNDRFRDAALDYYVRTNKDKARELALGVLAHPDSEILRRSCIRALGGLKDKPGDRRVFDALVKVVQERSFGARNDAMDALAQYGDKAAIQYIQPLTDNSMVFTRRTAQGAVKALGG